MLQGAVYRTTRTTSFLIVIAFDQVLDLLSETCEVGLVTKDCQRLLFTIEDIFGIAIIEDIVRKQADLLEYYR